MTTDTATLENIDAENPWPGLAAFREADRDLFVGREAEAEELLRLVLRERVAVLFGLSGLGKTSLLQAGLFPRLRDEGILPVPLRIDWSATALPCTGQILGALAQAAAASGVEMPAVLPGETLWELFHRSGNEFWSARNRPVSPLLAFDQLEEIFTLGQARPDAAELIETLASLAEGYPPAAVKARLDENPAEFRAFTFSRHPYKILLSLREDFLPELEALRRRIPGTLTNRLRLHRMDGGDALRVVTVPGRGLIEADVAETVVRFVAGEAPGGAPAPLAELEVEPALLSVICRELNVERRRRGMPRITGALLESGREEILGDFYERSVGDLGPEIRTFIEEHLLTKSGFRDSVALENALASEGVGADAVTALTDRRLLRVEDRGGVPRLELTHDVLAGVVRASRDTRRQREAQAAAETARHAAEERERKIRRDLRRSRQVLALFALLLLGVAGFAFLAYSAQRTARRALAGSDLERAQAQLAQSRPQKALAWLADALRQDPENLEARSLIDSLLLSSPWLLPVREIPLREADVEFIEISPDGRTAAVVTTKREILRLIDLEASPAAERIVQEESGIDFASFTPDGTRLITRTGPGLRLWDARTGRPLGGRLPEGDCLGRDCRVLLVTGEGTARFLDTATGRDAGPPASSALRFQRDAGPGGLILSIAEKDGVGAVLVHDIRSGRTLGPPLTTGRDVRIDSAGRSPDGRFLFAVTSQGVQLWNAETHFPIAFLRHSERPVIVESDAEGRTFTVDQNRIVRIWDAARTTLLAQSFQIEDIAHRFQLSPDGRSLLAVSLRGKSLLSWNLATGTPLYQPVDGGQSIGFRGDGDSLRVAATRGGEALRVLSPRQAAQSLLAAAGPYFEKAALSADARFAALLEQGRLTVRDTATARILGEPLPLPSPPEILQFVPGDRLVAIQGGEALTWSFRSGGVRRVPLGFAGLQGVVSPDGTRAVFTADDPEEGGLRQVDLLTGETLARSECRGVLRQDLLLAFSADSRRLLLSASAAALRLADARTGKILATLEHPEVAAAVLSPDGRRILTTSFDGAARLWDAASGRLSRTLTKKEGLARAEIAADGRRALTVDGDLRARLMDLESGGPLGNPIPTARAGDVRLSPDGRRVLVITFGSTRVVAQLWDSRTGHPLGQQLSVPGAYFQSAFSADGRRFLLATSEQVRSMDVPFGSADDADLLARWAEAAGGFTVDPLGGLKLLPDQVARLDALRRETARAPFGQDNAASLLRWFFADPSSRPRTPFSTR